MPRALLMLLIAAGALVGTLIVTLIVLNLSLGNKHIDSQLRQLPAATSAEFATAATSVLRVPMTDGNDVTALVNGDEIFPAMLAAIADARTSITLETYIYWSGGIGEAFTEALLERAQAGVPVKVLLDWFGSELDDKLLERMRGAGIEIRRYNAPV
jgi:cardiolipin synthase